MGRIPAEAGKSAIPQFRVELPSVRWQVARVFMKTTLPLIVLAVSACLAHGEPFPVRIRVDAARPTGPLKPIWRFFGADEPNYAYMKHGDGLLGKLGSLKRDQVFFRAHSLLVTGEGTHGLKWGSTNAYTEDARGNPVYDWTIVDRIFDAYRKNGVRPYVQIGFMPQAMSVEKKRFRPRPRATTTAGPAAVDRMGGRAAVRMPVGRLPRAPHPRATRASGASPA